MTQPAYNILSDAITSGSNQVVSIHNSRISVSHIQRKKHQYVRLTWGPRGAPQRREFQDVEKAVTFAGRVVEMLQSKAVYADRVPATAIVSLEQALAELPGVSVQMLVESYRANHDEVCRSRSVPAVVSDYIAYSEAKQRSIRHIQTLRYHLNRFAKVFPRPISSLTTDDIDQYLHLIGQPKTRNNHRISLMALFQFAKKRGDLPYSEATPVERTDATKVVAKEPEIISAEDLETLLLACDEPKLKMFLLLGAFAGCRTAEIQRIQWRHITPEGLLLTPDITKTNRRRVVEIPENLREWLGTITRKNEDDPVSFIHNPALYAALKKLCSRVGFSWVDNGLRHGYVSHHLEKFGDPIRTSKNTGHSLRELESSYLKLVSKTDADRWFAILPLSANPKPEEEERTPPCQTNSATTNAA